VAIKKGVVMSSIPPTNILLVSPKTPDSFWHLKQSVRLTGKKALVPPLGLITVAALFPREWQVRLVDRTFQEIDDDLWKWTDVVMLSGMLVQENDLLRVAAEAKQRGKVVCAGGPYATSCTDNLLKAGIDFVIRGEAELSFTDFLSAFLSGQRGAVVQAVGKPDLACSPIPRFDLVDPSAYNTMSVQTSRGCPFACEFCDITSVFGRTPRYKDPDQVISELSALYKQGWTGNVFVCDDNFIGSKKRAKAILEKLTPWNKERGEPFSFWTQASVNLGQDKDMIDRMTDANFSTVFIGIESPDEAVLNKTRKYQNVRNPLAESIQNICANGLSIVGSFIIGFDGETKGTGQRICEFVEQTNIPGVMLNILGAAPNTALWDRLKKENRLLENQLEGVNGEGGLNFVPMRPAEEIIQEYMAAIDRLYEPSTFLRRAHRYYMNMRPTRKALGLENGSKPARGEPTVKTPFGSKLKDLEAVLIIAWRRGVKASGRMRFWGELIEIFRKNPSRIRSYMLSLGLGENLYPLKDDFIAKVKAGLPKLRNQRSSETYHQHREKPLIQHSQTQ